MLPVGLMEAHRGCGGLGGMGFAGTGGAGSVGSRGCCVSGSSSASCPASIAPARSSRRGVQDGESPCPHWTSLWSAVGRVLPSCRLSEVRFRWRCDGWPVGSATSGLSAGAGWSQVGSRCSRRERVPHHAGSPWRCMDLLHVL